MGNTVPRMALAFSVATLATLAGCARHHRAPTTQPTTMATDIDPATATADYWLDQPAVADVQSRQYERLFDACDHVLRQRYFVVDRSDYRDGIITSKPLVSQQIWEFWRDDVGTVSQEMNSTLGTYRRTVHWTIKPGETGEYIASPRVLVERFTDEPRRITAVTDYGSAASSVAAQTKLESPKLASVRADRWYAVGRDKALERELAKHASDWMTGR